MPKRTVKKEKPKPNMPANIKVSIPHTTSKSTDGTGQPTPTRGRLRLKKTLDFETKRELANEVARKQLTKPVAHHINYQLEVESQPTDNVTHSLDVNTHQLEVGNMPNRKKRTSKKERVVSNFFQNRFVFESISTAAANSMESLQNTLEKQPEPIRRIVTRKRLADSTAQENSKRLKEQHDITPANLEIKNEDISDNIPFFLELPDSDNFGLQPVFLEPQSVAQPKSVIQPGSRVKQPKSTMKKPQLIAKQPGPKVKPPTEKQPAARKKRTPKVPRKRLADSTAQEKSKFLKEQQNIAPANLVIKTEDISDDVPVFLELSDINNVETQPIVLKTQSFAQPRPTVAQTPPTVIQPQPTKSTMKKPQPKVKQARPKAKSPTMKQPATPKKKTPKGKQVNVVAGAKSSSILEKLRKLSHKETENQVNNQQVQHKSAVLVDSRKSSISSNSNLSWTKDISSSSTSTCITVSSNDFVRFNKKLPILKLTNIDQEVNKRKNVKEATVIDEDDDSSETSDSSDSSDSQHKCSEQLNNSIEVNSLHLSASSPSSSHSSQICSKDNSLDYIKAAKKLTITMKKIDMEIINWISSENTDVNANLAKFKNKMFEVLDHEFGLITHCRRLKEILDPRVIEETIENPCIPNPVENNAVNNNTEINPNCEKDNPTLDNNNKVQIHKEGEIIKEVDTNKEVESTKEIETNKETETNKKLETNKEVEFVKPKPCRKLSNISEGNVSITSNNSNRDDCTDDDNPTGNTRNYIYSDHHDDDDALSLFAESITGFESSRMTNSIASAPNVRQVEEYIPQPLKDNYVPHIEKPTYCPTKIREEAEMFASKIKTICEKQNADSTSIYKQSNSTDDAESYQDFNENTELDTKMGAPEMITRPQLMDSLFQILPKTKSIVFGGLCFYNLMNCCRKMALGQCRFRHLKPQTDEIKAKLNLLDDRVLIQEYLLLRNWAYLRRQYGMCYVEECAKRGLTRILVEIAYDFIVKARNMEGDTRLRVNTIEVTLLHLNNVDLSVCEDLLKLTIHSDQINKTLLCDVFMATMSITQNFSRFKQVFLNLTYFMVDNDRVFNMDVVKHILERICILPFEEPIARALIQMMRLTRPEIFKNSMIGHFEKQIAVNKDVFEEYSLLKNRYEFTSMLASSVVRSSSPPPPPSEPRDEGQPAPSPDTTNLDNMNKMSEEVPTPLITRTIGMNPPIFFDRVQISPRDKRAHVAGPSRAFTSPGSSNSDDNVKKWRNRAIFPHIFPPPLAMHHPRPQMQHRQGNFNERLVTFRGPINYIHQRPGPKY